MKRWFALVILVLALFNPGNAFAQNPIEFDKVKIALWPEYDRPDVLVVYRMSLSPKTSLPAKISMRIPSRVGKPYNVAMQDVDGLLYNLDFTMRQEGDWNWIDFTTTSPDIQIEYYDPNLEHDQNHRTFAYQWPGDYPVSSMTAEVQQPAGATNMKITPDMGTGRKDQDGLTYFTSLIGQLAASATFGIDVQYDKANNELSSSLAPVKAPDLNQVPGRTSFLALLPWLLGVLGFVLIIGGVFWYWQAGQHVSQKPQSRHSPKPKSISTPGKSVEIYCHQCGKRAEPGDDFCRMCGTRLRTE